MKAGMVCHALSRDLSTNDMRPASDSWRVAVENRMYGSENGLSGEGFCIGVRNIILVTSRSSRALLSSAVVIYHASLLRRRRAFSSLNVVMLRYGRDRAGNTLPLPASLCSLSETGSFCYAPRSTSADPRTCNES